MPLMGLVRAVYDCVLHGYVLDYFPISLDAPGASASIETVTSRCPLCGAVAATVPAHFSRDAFGHGRTVLTPNDPARLDELKSVIGDAADVSIA